VEDSDSRVRLLCSGPREEIIAKADIEQMRVSDLSVMPEGLEAQMSDDDFRDMILYVLSAPAEASPGP
jgi:hypothetical protein